MSGPWIAVLVTSAGCYALKLAGLTIPERLHRNPWLRRFAELVPVALLAALVAVEAAAKGSALVFDPARLAGLAAAVVALLLRAPFLVVIIAAAAVAALLRLAGVTLAPGAPDSAGPRTRVDCAGGRRHRSGAGSHG